MKKLLTIENCFDRLPEGCLIIPPLPYIALHDFDIDIDATDRQSQKLFTVELRTKGRDIQKKKARFMHLSSKTGFNFACFLQDTKGSEIEGQEQLWSAEIWI